MTPSTMHTDRMKEHLLAQFADKPVIYAELEALGAELDLLHQTMFDLKEKRWIDTGEGVQLDNIGTIVNQSRHIDNAIQIEFFGFAEQANTKTFDVGRFRNDDETWMKSTDLDDDWYRNVLRLKVFKDTSYATADDILNSVSVVFNTDSVILHEERNAKVILGIGKSISPNELLLIKSTQLIICAAGVGIDAIETYDTESYFGFLGQQNAKTFDQGVFADLLDL